MMPLPDDLAALGTPEDAPVPDEDLDLTDEEQVAMIRDTGNPADPDDPNPDAPRKVQPE